MNDLVELEELRTLVPASPVAPMPAGRLAARRDALMEAMAQPPAPEQAKSPGTMPPSAPRRRRVRRRVAALILIPAALLGGALAYSTTINHTAQQLGNEVNCFQSASLDAPTAGGPLTGRTLAQYCEWQWSSGSLIYPPPGPAPTQWVACQAAGEGLDVFPGTDQDTCRRLGLEPLPPEYYEAAKQFSGTAAELSSKFPENSCLNAPDATRITRDVLDAHGYSAWTIRVSGFADVTPCASIPDLDAVNGVATISGAVRPELLAAAERGALKTSYCGPADVLLANVRSALAAAGFGDWTVRLDHAPTQQWPCFGGWNEYPSTKTIVLLGHASLP